MFVSFIAVSFTVVLSPLGFNRFGSSVAVHDQAASALHCETSSLEVAAGQPGLERHRVMRKLPSQALDQLDLQCLAELLSSSICCSQYFCHNERLLSMAAGDSHGNPCRH